MRMIVAALLVLMPIGVLAQDWTPIDQTKTYGTEADCGFGDGGGLTLSFPRGIEGYEYHCDFFDVKQSKDSPFLFVDAVCEAPDIRNPDILSISPYTENEIEVVSLNDSASLEATDENPNPGVTIYTACK